MDRPVHIAVVGTVDDALLGDLRQLPLAPSARAFRSLVADSEALARFEPDVLLVAFGAEAAEEIGALRLLRQLWPNVALVLVTTADHELQDAPLAARLRAQLLVYPDTPGQLAAAIEQARLGGDRPRPDTFLDLARGIADEINNPLMFVAGHLQLLRASFEATAADQSRDQVQNALAGVARIQAAVDRLRLCSQAANGPRQRVPIDLAALLRAASGERTQVVGRAWIELLPGEALLTGDREQLTAAIAALVRFADELATAGATVRLELAPLPKAPRLQLLASGAAVAGWHLPLSFEPYYPSRALRGHSPGLGLFLVQAVMLGHRGQATVRRLADGALQFDFVLPA
jgi:signal transduction histidine kinase